MLSESIQWDGHNWWEKKILTSQMNGPQRDFCSYSAESKCVMQSLKTQNAKYKDKCVESKFSKWSQYKNSKLKFNKWNKMMEINQNILNSVFFTACQKLCSSVNSSVVLVNELQVFKMWKLGSTFVCGNLAILKLMSWIEKKT